RMGSASPTRPRTRGSPPDAVYTPLDLTSITPTAIAVVHTEVVVFPTAVAVMRTKVAVMPIPVAAAQSQVVVMHQATAVTQISVAVMHRQATGIANPVAARSIPVGVTPAEVSGARTAFPLLPAEDLERHEERDDSPTGHDAELGCYLGEAVAFVDDASESLVDRGERQG